MRLCPTVQRPKMLNGNTQGFQGNWDEHCFLPVFFPQFFISYFPSPWPVFLLQNSSSWTFWRTPQIALHTIPSSFQKDPIICPALVPLTSLIIGLQTFLQIAQVLLSAKQSWERWVLFVVVQPYCWSRTGIRTFD